MWKTILSGSVWYGEVVNRRKDGSLYTEEMTITPVRGAQNKIAHFVAVKQDVTGRKQMEESLLHAKDAAEAADRTKSQFLSSMSHELRTPLNSIIGFSDLMLSDTASSLSSEQNQYLKDISESGRHLANLVSDILAFTESEKGKTELALEDVDLKELLESSLLAVKQMCKTRSIRTDIRLGPQALGCAVIADRQKLKLVLANLLSNAVKFTPDSGTITAEAEVQERLVHISVADSGEGIAPEDQEKIFEAFFQVRGGLKGKTPGTGIGLGSARRLVELHGGRIWVDSDGRGRGSRFTFTIPIKQTRSD